MGTTTALYSTIINCLREYAPVAADPVYWDGIRRRVQYGAPLTKGEIFHLNELIRNWTEYTNFDYRTTHII